MHCIFVACNKNKNKYKNDPSFIYRCENLAQGLQKLGHTTELLHLKSLPINLKADVVIFHRPTFSLKLFFISKYLKYRSILTFVDTDDLIFDPDKATDSPAVRNNILPLKTVKKNFQNHLKAFKLFDNFTVSTDPIYKHIKTLLPQSKVIKISNTVHHSWNKIQQKNTKTQKRLTYFPGTKSHDKDFALIAKTLEQFLSNHSDVILSITGPLRFTLNVPKEQVVYNEKVPFHEHFNNYKNTWVNLAPLEKTSFTECKSALKVIEASHFGIPTICTDIPDTNYYTKHGAIQAKNADDFLSKLEMLYDSNNYQQTIQIMQNNKDEFLSVIDTAEIFFKYVQKRNYLDQPFIEDPKYTLFIARSRRKAGKYDYKTLRYYKKTYLLSKNMNHFLEYCMFRRDLGYIITKNHAKKLQMNFNKLNKKSKLLSSYLIKETEENNEMINIFQDTIIKKQSICVVGNSYALSEAENGYLIDKYDFIFRFNNCWSKMTETLNTGNKINAWVSAPDYKGAMQNQAEWIIISGPDTLHKGFNLDKLKHYEGNIIGIPLYIWKELVHLLQAPPSAGVLILFWIRNIIGSWKKISMIGFDLNELSQIYHHADHKHPPGQRHDWIKEKKLLRQWTTDGLKIVG